MKAAALAAGGKSLTLKPPLAQQEMKLEVCGRRVQTCCAVVGMAEEPDISMATICSVLLEAQAGRRPWYCSGEVLEP
jgi:hypothetical protein